MNVKVIGIELKQDDGSIHVYIIDCDVWDEKNGIVMDCIVFLWEYSILPVNDDVNIMQATLLSNLISSNTIMISFLLLIDRLPQAHVYM